MNDPLEPARKRGSDLVALVDAHIPGLCCVLNPSTFKRVVICMPCLNKLTKKFEESLGIK